MKKSHDNSTIAIAAFTIFTILLWVGFDIYHIKLTSTIPENLKKVVLPLNPTLDTKTFKLVLDKKTFDKFEKSSSASSLIQIPTPSPSIASESSAATESGSLNE